MQPFSQKAWAICGACGQAFVFAATPMPLEAFVVCMKRARCPACDERKRVFVCDHMPTESECRRLVARLRAPEGAD